MYKFEVVTKVYETDLAIPMNDLYAVQGERTQETGWVEPVEKLNIIQMIGLRQSVFHLGEIIIINENGREVAAPGRKADKWSVDTEVFDNLEDAVKRAEEVIYGS